MKLNNRNLSIEMRGEDVVLLKHELRQLGHRFRKRRLSGISASGCAMPCSNIKSGMSCR